MTTHPSHTGPSIRSSTPEFSGNADLLDPDRWQPMALRLFVDQAGNLADGIHEFVTPQWGRVVPFALGEDDLTVYQRAGADYHVYHDPGPPPTLGGPLAELYKWGFSLVGRWSSHLAPGDGARIDISPAGIGNVGALPQAFEDHRAFYDPVPWGPGHALNPATGRPYEAQWVPRGDYTRVLAEFWADGPDSETPPGHWFVILNTVNDHESLVRRMGGEGPVLDPLEWDVKAYFTLGGAMHDAAVAAWGIKGWYDYIRPISALRAMAGRGQSVTQARLELCGDGMESKCSTRTATLCCPVWCEFSASGREMRQMPGCIYPISTSVDRVRWSRIDFTALSPV